MASIRIERPDGPVEFENLQAAINAARDGETVLIPEGTYNEHVTISGKDGITLQGENYPKFVVSGDDPVFYTHLSGTITVEGLSFVSEDGRPFNQSPNAAMSRIFRTLVTDQILVLDYQKIVSTTFRNCRLIFRGGRPPTLKDVRFENCEFLFEGPAEYTVSFLRDLRDAGLEDLVDTIFEGDEG